MSRKLVSGMTICAAAGALALMTGSLATAASPPGKRLTVNPGAGSPTTTFRLHFRAPEPTGRDRGLERYYVVSASGPSGSGSCVGQTAQDPTASHAHARVRVKMSPGTGGWCSGTFHGTVTEQERPICQYREVCPLFVVLVKTIGRFSFRVTARPRSSDTTPPVFAGLQAATTCTPGPSRPGQTTPYHLTWKAARDNVTPRSRIVYDVFESSTSGAEDFAKPSWATSPGATVFTTPNLPANSTVYFVVRARDRAGNEDHNHVQRAGVNPCL